MPYPLLFIEAKNKEAGKRAGECVLDQRDFEAFYEACDGTGYVARKRLYNKNNQGKGG